MSDFYDKWNSLTGYNQSIPLHSSSAKDSKEQQIDENKDNNNINIEDHQHQNKKQLKEGRTNSSYGHKKNIIFKYTSVDQLLESIILKRYPVFLNINENKEINIVDTIEETTRILIPPATEEYPSNLPYVFENKEEIDKFVKMIIDKGISIDTLFFKIREYISKFIIHKDYVLDYIVALIIFSYFQDLFPTYPYTMFVSDNGSGKSTIGNVFEFIGYRCINMTDPTTANIFRIFGTIEAGQCTLVLDEAEKIDRDHDMMSILKNGFEKDKKVQRINHLGKQEHFHTSGPKILLAERTPNPSVAKGVLERTFVIYNYAGIPELDIKEIRNAPPTNSIKKELLFLRKALLVNRLLFFSNGKRFDDIYHLA